VNGWLHGFFQITHSLHTNRGQTRSDEAMIRWCLFIIYATLETFRGHFEGALPLMFVGKTICAFMASEYGWTCVWQWQVDDPLCVGTRLKVH
jgi:hypothetical protein